MTPARNEIAHVDRLVDAMVAQHVRPDLWVVVDDSSTDGTGARLRVRTASVPFVRLCSLRDTIGDVDDRLSAGAAPRAFNAGVSAAGDLEQWDFVGKIDADIEIPPDYFATLLSRFAANPELGLASGTLFERHGASWAEVRVPGHHVPGAVKLYSGACFRRIGGVESRLGWDTLDEMKARMHGFETRSFGDLLVRHHRETGAAAGVLRGKARHGACAWIGYYPAYFVALRSLRVAATRPFGVSGLAFLAGYTRAAARRLPRIEDEQVRRHVRRELRGRLLRRLALTRTIRKGGPEDGARRLLDRARRVQ